MLKSTARIASLLVVLVVAVVVICRISHYYNKPNYKNVFHCELEAMVCRLVYLNYGPKALRDGADQNGIACGSNQQFLSVHVCDGANCPKVIWNLIYFIEKQLSA